MPSESLERLQAAKKRILQTALPILDESTDLQSEARTESARTRAPWGVGITRAEDGELALLVLGELDEESRRAISEAAGIDRVLLGGAIDAEPLGRVAGSGLAGRLEGTLGAVCYDRGGNRGVLTALHVALDLYDQQARTLHFGGTALADTWHPSRRDPQRLYADAVFAPLRSGVSVDPRQGGFDPVEQSVLVSDPEQLLRQPVVKWGAASGRSDGVVDAVAFDILGVPGFSDVPGFTVSLRDQILVSSGFAVPGDSGALAWLRDYQLALGLVSARVRSELGERIAVSAWWNIDAVLGVVLAAEEAPVA